MSTQTPKCQNPFFPCLNTEPELKIQVDIQMKGEKYSICPNCWKTISESENYQWQTTTTPQKEQPLEPNWKPTQTTEGET